MKHKENRNKEQKERMGDPNWEGGRKKGGCEKGPSRVFNIPVCRVQCPRKTQTKREKKEKKNPYKQIRKKGFL